MHLTRRIPNILLAAVTAAAYIWACFAANFAEQFVCLNSAAAVLGSAARWIASAGFIALPAALLYGEQRCRAAAIFAVLPATLFGLAFSGRTLRYAPPRLTRSPPTRRSTSPCSLPAHTLRSAGCPRKRGCGRCQTAAPASARRVPPEHLHAGAAAP